MKQMRESGERRMPRKAISAYECISFATAVNARAAIPVRVSLLTAFSSLLFPATFCACRKHVGHCNCGRLSSCHAGCGAGGRRRRSACRARSSLPRLRGCAGCRVAIPAATCHLRPHTAARGKISERHIGMLTECTSVDGWLGLEWGCDTGVLKRTLDKGFKRTRASGCLLLPSMQASLFSYHHYQSDFLPSLPICVCLVVSILLLSTVLHV